MISDIGLSSRVRVVQTTLGDTSRGVSPAALVERDCLLVCTATLLHGQTRTSETEDPEKDPVHFPGGGKEASQEAFGMPQQNPGGPSHH